MPSKSFSVTLFAKNFWNWRGCSPVWFWWSRLWWDHYLVYSIRNTFFLNFSGKNKIMPGEIILNLYKIIPVTMYDLFCPLKNHTVKLPNFKRTKLNRTNSSSSRRTISELFNYFCVFFVKSSVRSDRIESNQST